jgi:putative CocE/NonD family hydrolase
MTKRKDGDPVPRSGWDDYEEFRRAVSANGFARLHGFDQLPWWRKTVEHPAYDLFWREQALDRILEGKPLKVPTMWIGALWDQEDRWGAVHAYAATESKDTGNDRNHLVLGPWRHSQQNYDGSTLGPLRWEGDTALQYRRDLLKPFFDRHLKGSASAGEVPGVAIYDTGRDRWDRLERWPRSCPSGCPDRSRALALGADSTLVWGAPAGAPGYTEYVSDPAKPVPYIPRPMRFGDRDAWRNWLVTDQRSVADRPDVLVYQTPPLTEPLTLSGSPLVHLVASTTGTDSDWVVKLIDVHPDQVPSQPELGGYQLPIAMEIFRGRYRQSFERPSPLEPGKPLDYSFELPAVNHTFLPGHRIMVQVQSSWFPLYDRNPQRFVPNIFLAEAGDFTRATQRIHHGAGGSYLELPVAPPR